MEINCTIFIRELAERTLRNYNYIKERAHEDNLYEVTQLINSMYCLLVVPEEIFGIRRQDNPDSEFALKTKFSTREKNLKKYAGYWEIVKLLDELKTQNRVRNVEIGAFEEECHSKLISRVNPKTKLITLYFKPKKQRTLLMFNS